MRHGLAPDQSLQLSRKPQELCLQDTEQFHSTQPSLFSAFLHHVSKSCVLQLAGPQLFPLHFPPTGHSYSDLFYCLACCFLPHVFPSSCPTWLPPLSSASDQHTSPAPACQELSATHCAQDTTQHDPVPGCNGSSKHNEEDESICIVCCH